MYEKLLQSLLKYGPEILNKFNEAYKKEEVVGTCCCCNKGITVGLKNAKFDFANNQLILCCGDPVCNAFLKLKSLGSTYEYIKE